MNYILFDGPERTSLLPFTFTRPVADIRIGIRTLREKWEHFLKTDTSTKTEAYLSKKWPLQEAALNVWINPAFLPTENIVKIITGLEKGQALYFENQPIAYVAEKGSGLKEAEYDIIQYTHTDLVHIVHTWDIFSKNHEAIARDYKQLTHGRTSQALPEGVIALHPERIFIEPGATVQFCSLNATDGPIYIGKDSEIMEGSLIRGPFALCEGATLKMGAKIYTGTTIGPHSKVGGEVNNSVIFGYSNKGHDGFLGNSVLGEWCNLGADTNISNLKNNYSEVRLWSYQDERFAHTGLQFCGLMMGDHSKCGINTMFNTGTVVGVSANIFGSGYPRNFIPSFSWGGSKGTTTYKTNKAFEVAEQVMQRRSKTFDDTEAAILQQVFDDTTRFRRD
ncbi:GlmU family protein [Altibacter sp. HG106]|uniref:GlmU family protein n=1 Tax=Altibacter sp. HG106 TaxID=3023937 RepID=UPI002350723D|nr:GlmU family protein [Altibacter sp. HG106]MDC7993768.1 GlmU family protein [Altibacter sp. HG106]